jgi:hypothetical protein
MVQAARAQTAGAVLLVLILAILSPGQSHRHQVSSVRVASAARITKSASKPDFEHGDS